MVGIMSEIPPVPDSTPSPTSMEGAPQPDPPSALIIDAKQTLWLSWGGEIEHLSHRVTKHRLENGARVVLCHAPQQLRWLGLYPPTRGQGHVLSILDILTLYSFVCPITPIVPTPNGLAHALNLPLPGEDKAAQAMTMLDAARALLARLRASGDAQALAIARIMAAAGWEWGRAVLTALSIVTDAAPASENAKETPVGLAVWKKLPEIQWGPPPPPPSQLSVSEAETRLHLARILGQNSEIRPSQADFSAAITWAFHPRAEENAPNVVLAEAGTGVGKTLAYLAPAQLWAKRNHGGVVISTFTRNLQSQIMRELERLYPSHADMLQRCVVRKGRENYICLLNYQEAVDRLPFAILDEASLFVGTPTQPQTEAIGLGLMARWLAATEDGDLTGGRDFAGYLPELVGRSSTSDLADKRGECIHAGCVHYRKCLVERSIHRAEQAEIIVANHALVLSQLAAQFPLNAEESEDVPNNAPPSPSDTTTEPSVAKGEKSENGEKSDEKKMLGVPHIFDEGHHLFDAADSAFSLSLTLDDAAQMRRWLIGGAGQAQQNTRMTNSLRSQGLLTRLDQALFHSGQTRGHSPQENRAISDLTEAAYELPQEGWAERMLAQQAGGLLESLFRMIRQQILHTSPSRQQEDYPLECEKLPVWDGIAGLAAENAEMMRRLLKSLTILRGLLLARLEGDGEELSPQSRAALQSLAESMQNRAIIPLGHWQNLLQSLPYSPPPNCVGWFELTRYRRLERNIGIYRHFIDPTRPLASAWQQALPGLVITSATLTESSEAPSAAPNSVALGETPDANPSRPENSPELAWRRAEQRCGTAHFTVPSFRARVASPFNYAAQTKILIVTNVGRYNLDERAAAYRDLFRAAGGGGLGLFTAIDMLREIHRRLLSPLAESEITLLAQHIDPMNRATLIDIFRAEENSCLLGTDAIRDGVDVPGRSLRLLIFDRVPWPRPTILHRARRDHYGGHDYDESLARLKLKQAFGRLIRRQSDRGVFILLDRQTPTRLLTAFPSDVVIERVFLSEAIAITRDYLADKPIKSIPGI
ncbi:MAG: ATP-dependent DNA helicase [Alphaproteobacteria bacterium]|nr:ATP-dependent DNA helicase [Alphaproteobacteria bacterium]